MAKKNSQDKINKVMYGMYDEDYSSSASVPYDDALKNIQTRAPFFSTFAHASYLSQSQMNYTPRTTISSFSNISHPSYISKPLLQDQSDRALFETFLSPFMEKVNTGSQLQDRTIETASTWLDMPYNPVKRNVHNFNYYKNRFNALFTAKTITAFDTETIGENIWQIGYAYGSKGLDTDINNKAELETKNVVLLPEQEELKHLFEVADSDYATLSDQDKVIYKTLSNMGSDDTQFNRVVDNTTGLASYDMSSYADADVSKKNALKGYDKLRALVEQSAGDKKLNINGYTLRSDQISFLNAVGKIFSSDMVYGHNIERFDIPKLIHTISGIHGGFDYLSDKFNIEREHFYQSYLPLQDDPYSPLFDLNDMIRTMSTEQRIKLQDEIYGFDSPYLTEDGATPWRLSTLKKALNLESMYREFDGKSGVSHAADFDAMMSFALLKNKKMMDLLQNTVDSDMTHLKDETSLFDRIQNNVLTFKKGSFGYMNSNGIRIIKENAEDGNFVFDTGYVYNGKKLQDNGFAKDYHILNGTVIPKDSSWLIKRLEEFDITEDDSKKIAILKKIAPQLVDSNLIHMALANYNNENEIIHLFGSKEDMINTLSRIADVSDDSWDIKHTEKEKEINNKYEKRKLDRARRTVERSSTFTQNAIDDVYNIVSGTEKQLARVKNFGRFMSRKELAKLMMQQASAIATGISTGAQLTLDLQNKLGISGQQIDVINNSVNKIIKMFDFGTDKNGIRQFASNGYLSSIAAIVSLPNEYHKVYNERLINPIMAQVDEILHNRYDAFEFGDIDSKHAALSKSRMGQVRKQISGIVHQQVAEEIARRHPELARVRDENRYLLDTITQGDPTRVGKQLYVDFSKNNEEYNLIKRITNFYDMDPEMTDTSPSRQFDTMVRFIMESNDPALRSLQRDITRKSEKGLKKPEAIARYRQVQNIIQAENLNPVRLSQLMIERIKEYRDQNPDSGIFLRNAVDLELAKEHPEVFTELARDEKFKDTLTHNAMDAAYHIAGNPNDFMNEIADNVIQDRQEVIREAEKMYGAGSQQAKHLTALYDTVAAEYEFNIQQFVKASYGTQLKFDRTTGQFMLYDSSGHNGTDITKFIPRIEMHGGTLAARLGNTSYALNMGFDYIGRDNLTKDFTLRSNLERAFETAYPVRLREKTTDKVTAMVGFLRDFSKRFRNDGAVYINEGNMQDAKYNFSLDFSHSYKGLVALSGDEQFLATLSSKDAEEFRKQFWTKFQNLQDPTNFLAKLDEGTLDAQQRNIVNRILPNLNDYMITSHDNNSRGNKKEIRRAESDLWNNYMSQLYFDYKNHMVSEGIVLTDEIGTGMEAFTRLSRDVHNQVTRATMFEKDASARVLEQLGITDVTFGNMLTNKGGDFWFNSRTMNGTEYTATMQAPVFVGDNATLSNRVQMLMDNLQQDPNTDKILNKKTGEEVSELSGMSLDQIKQAAQQLIDKTNVSEGGAILDARLVDATGVTNDMNPIKLKDDLRIIGFEDVKNIRDLQDANKLIPIIEKDADGNLHMRYVPGKYYKAGSELFRRINGYAASEQTIYQKENGIVKAGVFNAANKLVDAKTVSRDVLNAAKRTGKTVETAEDFYNILQTTLKGKYYTAFYNDRVDGQGVVKMVRDMSEKAETTQIYGHIGSIDKKVLPMLKKLGLERLPNDISYSVFKDLTDTGFAYNDYLASLVNDSIDRYNSRIRKQKGRNKKKKMSYVDASGKTRYSIESASDWEAWVSSRIGHQGFEDLSERLKRERYLMSNVLHAATGGYGVSMDAFIHHNGVGQPVNQLVSDMVLYERTKGKDIKEANASVYNALQPDKAEDAAFLLLDKEGNPLSGALRIDKDTGRILLPDNPNYNINVRNLQSAAERIYGKENGRKRFTEIMGGYSDADNDQEAVGIRNKEGKPIPLMSGRGGYTTTSSLSFIHDNTRNGYLGGMNTPGVIEGVNKAGNVSDRELTKASLIRRTTQSVAQAQQLWKDLGRSEDEFRSIYGIGLNDDVKLADKLNESIERPYIDEIRSNQFMSPEQLINANAKTNKDLVPMSQVDMETLSDREWNIYNTLTKEGYSPDKISLASVKELAYGSSGIRASMANGDKGVSDADRKLLVDKYDFQERSIDNINNVRTKQLAQGKAPNIFNTNMIIDMEDKNLGITKEMIERLGGVSSVATAAVSPRAFGSQEITTDITDAFGKLQAFRSRIATLQKKAGKEPENDNDRDELHRLYQRYASSTRDLARAQQRVATGNISALKNMAHVGMAYSIRPKVGVASEESFYGRDWAKTAHIDGMSVSDYAAKGKVAPDIVRISPKQAREMGLITADVGTNLYKFQLQDLMTNGVMAHTNRSPTNYAGSDVATRIFVGTDVQNTQAQLSHYLAVKMKADTDGDAARSTADQITYKQNVLMESQIRQLNSAKDDVNAFQRLTKSYGLRNINVSDLDIINAQWSKIAQAHRESEIYQQTVVNPALKHAEKTYDEILAGRHSNILSDAEMDAFRNEFAEQIIPDRLIGKNQDVLLGKANIPMLHSREATEVQHNYDLLQSEFRNKNNIDAKAELTGEQQKQFMRWAGQDKKRFDVVSSYNNLQENVRNILGKTRQAAAGIVDLPVYRMARMTDLAQKYLPDNEATELQNLFTVMQEGFLSPKNTSANDWNAVSDLIDITGRMGKMRNGTVDQTAFDDLAEWIRHNAAKAPNVKMIQTDSGLKLDKEYYAKMAQEKLPEMFKKMPNFFDEMAAADMIFLSRKGVDVDSLRTGLEASMHSDIAGNNMAARLLNVVGQNMADEDKARNHLRDTSDIVLPQVTRREPKVRPYNLDEAFRDSRRRGYEEALQRASRAVQHAGGAKKIIAGIVGGLGFAGYMGGNPSEDPDAERKIQQQQRPVNAQPMPNFSDTSVMAQRGLSSASGGYIININAQTNKGSDFAQQVINQATSNTFNQTDINITTHMKQDSPVTSPDAVADYVTEALSN